MLDMNWIKDNQELVRNITAWKRVDFPLDELLEWDEKRRELRQDTEQLRAQRNGLTKEVERLLRQGDSVAGEAVKEQVRELNNRLNLYEADLTEADRRCGELMLLAPNPVSQDTPIGHDDKDNVELRRTGTLPEFGFTPRDHVELGELHDIIDIPVVSKQAAHAAMC